MSRTNLLFPNLPHAICLALLSKMFEGEVYFKLKEAELEAETTDKRYSHKEVFDELRPKLSDRMKSDNV